mmetsp:Transcript_41246/g.74582  ORF Transcript_41246/g.74582 Transcript_41246/m.74582 type:complete len:220 (+) Transcript_41246:94-753(+)
MPCMPCSVQQACGDLTEDEHVRACCHLRGEAPIEIDFGPMPVGRYGQEMVMHEDLWLKQVRARSNSHIYPFPVWSPRDNRHTPQVAVPTLLAARDAMCQPELEPDPENSPSPRRADEDARRGNVVGPDSDVWHEASRGRNPASRWRSRKPKQIIDPFILGHAAYRSGTELKSRPSTDDLNHLVTDEELASNQVDKLQLKEIGLTEEEFELRDGTLTIRL